MAGICCSGGLEFMRAADRVVVFVDYQNAYKRAREVFGDPADPDYRFGQLFPRRLGVLLRQRAEDAGKNRELKEVRVYRGEPDAKRSPVGQAACQRQVRFWNAQEAVRAFTRPLDYRPILWENGKAVDWEVREKGIDVMLAVDMVRGAYENEYDVAILMSADTDLIPAAEAVLDIGKWIEFAAWRPDQGYASHLRLPNRKSWCHQLGRHDYEMVHDPNDYTKPIAGEPPSN
jgi:uncharacterized LabA/DUF88 family protein